MKIGELRPSIESKPMFSIPLVNSAPLGPVRQKLSSISGVPFSFLRHRDRQFPFVIWKNDTRDIGYGRV
jgi:hypothetical protein